MSPSPLRPSLRSPGPTTHLPSTLTPVATSNCSPNSPSRPKPPARPSPKSSCAPPVSALPARLHPLCLPNAWRLTSAPHRRQRRPHLLPSRLLLAAPCPLPHTSQGSCSCTHTPPSPNSSPSPSRLRLRPRCAPAVPSANCLHSPPHPCRCWWLSPERSCLLVYSSSFSPSALSPLPTVSCPVPKTPG